MPGTKGRKAAPKIKGAVRFHDRTFYAGDEEELQAYLDAMPESTEGRRGQKVSRQQSHRHLARSGALENFKLDTGKDFDPDSDVDEPDATLRAGAANRNARSEATSTGKKGRKASDEDDEGRPDSHIDAEGHDADTTTEDRAKAATELGKAPVEERPAHLRGEVPDTSAGNTGAAPAGAEAPKAPASASRGQAGRK